MQLLLLRHLSSSVTYFIKIWQPSWSHLLVALLDFRRHLGPASAQLFGDLADAVARVLALHLQSLLLKTKTKAVWGQPKEWGGLHSTEVAFALPTLSCHGFDSRHYRIVIFQWCRLEESGQRYCRSNPSSTIQYLLQQKGRQENDRRVGCTFCLANFRLLRYSWEYI